jgi:membrane-associated phospholipid phosphatase
MVGRQPAHPPHLHLEIPPVAVNTVLASTAPAPAAPASTTEAVELPVAPTEVRALAAVQRVIGWPPGVTTARGMSLFGEHAAGWLAVGLLGALVDRARRRDWVTATAGVAVAHGASIAVKRVVRRPRPADPRVQVLVGTPSRLSFPSAHATSTTAAAVLFGRLLGRRLAPVLVPPMALSRLVLGVHYPSDVAVGALLGAGVAAAVPTLERRLLGRFPR